MAKRRLKETSIFLGLTIFFGAGVLLTNRYLAIYSLWDYILVHVLTMMSGLGLTVVFLWWITYAGNKRRDAQPAFPEKVSREMPGRC